MKWEEFLEKCDSEVRPYFREAKTLAKAKTLSGGTKYRVGTAGKKVLDAFAIRLSTPNQEPGQTFFARLAAPNRLHFCFDYLVKERDFSPGKRQELLGYLQDKRFWKRDPERDPGEMEGMMNEANLAVFRHILDEVAAELKLD